jgi:hypothetical protein
MDMKTDRLVFKEVEWIPLKQNKKDSKVILYIRENFLFYYLKTIDICACNLKKYQIIHATENGKYCLFYTLEFLRIILVLYI